MDNLTTKIKEMDRVYLLNLYNDYVDKKYNGNRLMYFDPNRDGEIVGSNVYNMTGYANFLSSLTKDFTQRRVLIQDNCVTKGSQLVKVEALSLSDYKLLKDSELTGNVSLGVLCFLGRSTNRHTENVIGDVERKIPRNIDPCLVYLPFTSLYVDFNKMDEDVIIRLKKEAKLNIIKIPEFSHYRFSSVDKDGCPELSLNGDTRFLCNSNNSALLQVEMGPDHDIYANCNIYGKDDKGKILVKITERR